MKPEIMIDKCGSKMVWSKLIRNQTSCSKAETAYFRILGVGDSLEKQIVFGEAPLLIIFVFCAEADFGGFSILNGEPALFWEVAKNAVLARGFSIFSGSFSDPSPPWSCGETTHFPFEAL